MIWNFSIHFRVKMTQNNIFWKIIKIISKVIFHFHSIYFIGRNENASLDLTIMQKAKKHGNSEYRWLFDSLSHVWNVYLWIISRDKCHMTWSILSCQKTRPEVLPLGKHNQRNNWYVTIKPEVSLSSRFLIWVESGGDTVSQIFLFSNAQRRPR